MQRVRVTKHRHRAWPRPRAHRAALRAGPPGPESHAESLTAHPQTFRVVRPAQTRAAASPPVMVRCCFNTSDSAAGSIAQVAPRVSRPGTTRSRSGSPVMISAGSSTPLTSRKLMRQPSASGAPSSTATTTRHDGEALVRTEVKRGSPASGTRPSSRAACASARRDEKAGDIQPARSGSGAVPIGRPVRRERRDEHEPGHPLRTARGKLGGNRPAVRHADQHRLVQRRRDRALRRLRRGSSRTPCPDRSENRSCGSSHNENVIRGSARPARPPSAPSTPIGPGGLGSSTIGVPVPVDHARLSSATAFRSSSVC